MLETLSANDYPRRFIEHIANKRSRRSREHLSGTTQNEDRWVGIPYVQGMSEAIATVLRPLGIRVAHRALQWKWSVCAGIKDVVPPSKRSGV